MSLIDFAQLGGVVLMAVILYKVVNRFLDSQKKRDEQFIVFISKQEDNFDDLVKNHIHEDTQAKHDLEKSHQILSTTIRELLKWLEKNGRK